MILSTVFYVTTDLCYGKSASMRRMTVVRRLVIMLSDFRAEDQEFGSAVLRMRRVRLNGP